MLPRMRKFFKAEALFSELEGEVMSGDLEVKIFFNDSFLGLSKFELEERAWAALWKSSKNDSCDLLLLPNICNY